VDQGVVGIVFNNKGVVTRVDEYTKEAAKDVAVSTDKTPTEGNSITIWQQLLGNLGKFNTAGGGLPGQRSGSGSSPR
jgi:outer membrane protein assembly factor BamE (lipoprotein component of BamABCDE complex)